MQLPYESQTMPQRALYLSGIELGFFFLRRKRSYWLVSDGGLARSDFCCLKITPAG